VFTCTPITQGVLNSSCSHGNGKAGVHLSPKHSSFCSELNRYAFDKHPGAGSVVVWHFHTASRKRDSVGYCDTVKVPNPTKFGIPWENKALRPV